MRKKCFDILVTKLNSSSKVTAPLVTGYTLYYCNRPAFDSVKYLAHQNRLTGYIKVLNLLSLGVNPEDYLGSSITTSKGDIKLAALTDEQLTGLMQLIIKLTSI